MSPLTENKICYGKERNLCKNQIFKELNTNIFSFEMLNLFYKKRFEQSFMNSFYCIICKKL